MTGKVFEYVEPQDVIAAGLIVPGQDGGPPPPAPVPPYNESYAVQFGNGCNDVDRETPQSTADPGMISVHSQRSGLGLLQRCAHVGCVLQEAHQRVPRRDRAVGEHDAAVTLVQRYGRDEPSLGHRQPATRGLVVAGRPSSATQRTSR